MLRSGDTCKELKLKKQTKRTAIIYWFFTISYMGLIFYFSSGETPDLQTPQGFDKVFHAGLFALLAFLSYFSFKKSGVKKWAFPLSFVFATLYGITDELHQFYVPSREAAIGDVLADSFGGLLGSYLASAASVRSLKRR